jgi:hypothetical protein
MLVFEYKIHQTTIIDGVEQPLSDEYISTAVVPYTEESYAEAKKIAIEISEPYDNGIPEPVSTPSQLDVIEAQVFYTAMQTDTLIVME